MKTQLSYWKIQLKPADIRRLRPCQQRTPVCARGWDIGGVGGGRIRGNATKHEMFFSDGGSDPSQLYEKDGPKSTSPCFQNERVCVCMNLTW